MMQRWVLMKRFVLFSMMALVSGCAQLPELSSILSVPEEPPAAIRQEILLSPSVFGLAAHIKKKNLIKEKKAVQKVKVEPLVQQLRQKSEAGIREFLGNPYRTLREGQLHVRQYVTDICQWDMYFKVDSNNYNSALYDLVLHHQGRILTEDAEIAACEDALRGSHIVS